MFGETIDWYTHYIMNTSYTLTRVYYSLYDL